MGYIYEQSTGKLFLPGGKLLTVAYAGHGEGLNNPAMEKVEGVGPLPAGKYTFGPAFTHPHAGPLTMRLTPLPGTELWGRSGFLIHGDTPEQNFSASNGCIVAGHVARAALAVSDIRELEVVPMLATQLAGSPSAPLTCTPAPAMVTQPSTPTGESNG